MPEGQSSAAFQVPPNLDSAKYDIFFHLPVQTYAQEKSITLRNPTNQLCDFDSVLDYPYLLGVDFTSFQCAFMV